MSDNTKIEWADATVNAVNGCSLASPGCTNCYAMRLAGTRMRNHPTRIGLTQDSKAGPVWTGDVRLHEPALLQPLTWRRPRRIFWNAHGDLFHPNVPWEWIAKVMAVAFLAPHHIHMVLTKRADRMNAWFETLASEGGAEDFSEIIEEIAERVGLKCDYPEWTLPLENVWLGVSVEDQTRADERIPHLLETPAAVRFVSAEPLLGEVRLDRIKMFDRETPEGGWEAGWESALNGKRFDPLGEQDTEGWPKIDWVIVGGESGPGARPMHPAWARSLRDQCAAAGVQFHFKQWGEHISNPAPGATWPDGSPVPADLEPVTFVNVGKKAAGRLLDGVEHNGVPA